jgi:hypothetical protein
MTMTGIDIGPGVDDRDNRLALSVFRLIAGLHDARAVVEAAKIIRRKPARAAELLRRFSTHIDWMDFGNDESALRNAVIW